MAKKKIQEVVEEVVETSQGVDNATEDTVPQENTVAEEVPEEVEEVKETKGSPTKNLSPYQRIKFVNGPFKGLLGKTLTQVKGSSDWHVDIDFGGRSAIRVVSEEDIDKL